MSSTQVATMPPTTPATSPPRRWILRIFLVVLLGGRLSARLRRESFDLRNMSAPVLNRCEFRCRGPVGYMAEMRICAVRMCREDWTSADDGRQRRRQKMPWPMSASVGAPHLRSEMWGTHLRVML